MYFFAYIYMCCYLAVYLYFQFANTPLPGFLSYLNAAVTWGFILWGGYESGKIIVDCVVTNAKGQMTQANMLSGILLAILVFIPTLLISLFMLLGGFKN